MSLAVRVIPCLDVDGGRVVKGVNFVDLRDAGDPVELARAYDAEGADELTFLDISASHEGRATTMEIVSRTAEQVFIPLTVGGGVGAVDDVDRLLRAGADKVAVNTAAIRRPELVAEIADRFGNQVLVLSVDARRAAGTDSGFEVTTHGGRKSAGLDAVAWAVRAAELGAGEILLNAMDADGTKDGFDLELHRRRAPRGLRPGHRLGRRGRRRALRARGRRRRRRRPGRHASSTSAPCASARSRPASPPPVTPCAEPGPRGSPWRSGDSCTSAPGASVKERRGGCRSDPNPIRGGEARGRRLHQDRRVLGLRGRREPPAPQRERVTRRERSRVVRAWRLWRTRRPRTFSEKVRYKMLRDHRPLLVTVSDKAAVRDHVAALVGEQHLPRLHLLLDDAEALRHADLPDECVIKPTHGSGAAIAVSPRAPVEERLPDPDGWWACRHVRPEHLDREQLVQVARSWLSRFHGHGPNHEWAYTQVPRRILVEELLAGPDGGLPDDHKLFVFHGTCRYLLVDHDRFGDRTQDWFTADGTWLPIDGGYPRGHPTLPDRLPEMVALAERLGAGTDMVRVDLYVLPDRVVVGELTSYPAGGHSLFEPPSWDAEVGSHWHVPRRYR